MIINQLAYLHRFCLQMPCNHPLIEMKQSPRLHNKVIIRISHHMRSKKKMSV